MFKPGEIITQNETIVNGINTKDRKGLNRLSMVLFEFPFIDEEYVCTCPVTNHKFDKKNEMKKFIYIPYQILNAKKFCSLKLDTVFMYKKSEIHRTGLKLNDNIVLRAYEALINIDTEEFKLDKEHYQFIKDTIKSIIQTKKDLSREEKKEKKKQKVLKRKESKRNNIR